MKKRSIHLLVLIILAAATLFYLFPYKIYCPTDCEVYIWFPNNPSLIKMDNDCSTEVIHFLNSVKIKRQLFFPRYWDTKGELLDETNHVYVSVFTGQGIQRKKEYQILILLNQNRIIVEEFSKDPGKFKNVTCELEERKRFISFIQEIINKMELA